MGLSLRVSLTLWDTPVLCMPLLPLMRQIILEYFSKITNFTRDSLEKSVFPRDFEGPKYLKITQESPRQTKPKKGPKRKVHEFRPFL